jgi:hypothetical protein
MRWELGGGEDERCRALLIATVDARIIANFRVMGQLSADGEAVER